MMNNIDLPRESKCYDCIYRMSHLMIPFDHEAYDIEEGDVIAMNGCLLTDMDISEFVTIECSKYQSINDGGNPFMLNNKFLKRLG